MKRIFRGISSKTGKWVAGSLYIGINDNGKEYLAIIVPTITKLDKKVDDENSVIFNDDEFHVIKYNSAGQYLLDDKNDIPIYEGDIVIQSYKVKTRNVYGKMTENEVELEGFHIGVAKLTTEGTQLCSLKHFDSEGNLAENQPHKNSRQQIRSYRSKVIGNIFENPYLLKLKQLTNEIYK